MNIYRNDFILVIFYRIMGLKEKKCEPCEGIGYGLNLKQITDFMAELKDWSLENWHLVKYYDFKNFKENMTFVNKVAELAEQEGHHPSLFINYNKLKIELWTHAIKGLSENDFILAAKIDELKLLTRVEG